MLHVCVHVKMIHIKRAGATTTTTEKEKENASFFLILLSNFPPDDESFMYTQDYFRIVCVSLSLISGERIDNEHNSQTNKKKKKF